MKPPRARDRANCCVLHVHMFPRSHLIAVSLLHDILLVATHRFQVLLQLCNQIRGLHQHGNVTARGVQSIAHLIVFEEQIQWTPIDLG